MLKTVSSFLIFLALTAPVAVAAQENTADSVMIPSPQDKSADAGEFYHPPMPSKKFLTAEQAKIAASMHPTVDTLFWFPDAADAAHPELASTHVKLKAWIREEKDDIKRVLERILDNAPGLGISAASGAKIALIRADTLKPGRRQETEIVRGRPPASQSCPCAIALSDSFFRTPLQFHGLTHELVHEADLSKRVCDSKEWLGFIERPIAEARLKMALSPTYASKDIAAALLKENICPTEYSCTNEEEALAEMVSAYVEQDKFEPSQTFIDKFASRILVPNSANMQDELLFKQARIQGANKNYKTATEIVEKLVQKEPANISALVCASYYGGMTTEDKSTAFEYAQKADAAMRSVGMPWSDSERLWVSQVLTWIYLQHKYSGKAIEVIDEILAHVPYDPSTCYQRFYMEKDDNKLAYGIGDLYHACYPGDNARLLSEAAINPDLAQQILDKEVSLFPKMGLSLVRRGELEQWRGDIEKDAAKRLSYYKQALTDYKNAADDDMCGKQALFECCNVSVKLDDNTGAADFVEQARKRFPDSQETEMMTIQLAAAKGKSEEAAQELGVFRTKNWQMLDKLIKAAIGEAPGG